MKLSEINNNPLVNARKLRYSKLTDEKSLILILIFNNDEDIHKKLENRITNKDLLISPRAVGKEYWFRGYFYTVEHIEKKSGNREFWIL